jgi:hypothetical protein
MDEMVQWLRVQLDEDERIARAACEYASPEWRVDERNTTVLLWPPEPRVAEAERRKGLPVVSDQWRGVDVDSAGNAGLARHMSEHDPARVLREIDAKRQALDHYARICGHTKSGDQAYVLAEGAVAQQVKIMASGYSHRPGYREEWRP